MNKKDEFIKLENVLTNWCDLLIHILNCKELSKLYDLIRIEISDTNANIHVYGINENETE